MKINISDKIGSVTAELTEPKKMKAVFTLAHGAGAPMDHPFMKTMSKELEQLGIGTLRFNFPYMEAKKGRPDVPVVAHAAIEAAANHLYNEFPKTPIFLSGKSFGGRMSSQYMSKSAPGFVKGLAFFGFPLHAPGQPSVDRADHLKDIKVPLLFLQGTRDSLAQWDLIASVTGKLPGATLVKFEGADHSFKAGKANLLPDLAKTVAEWVTKTIA
ncbi:MAG TPA: alpha/beta family hydrolase [Cyclobacteriaceae bacterium]|nr:alpha/beta family hydrolase [Cyclobacteriaceae bacterium]